MLSSVRKVGSDAYGVLLLYLATSFGAEAVHCSICDVMWNEEKDQLKQQ
jgi:hypothetical protein